MKPDGQDLTAIIVGAGFGGLGTAIRLRQAGIEDFVVLEKAANVGGTWEANTYPGCQCDVPSHLYSFSFAPNPDWSRTFSRQPEIWDYLRRCAGEHGVLARIRFGCLVTDATWDGETQRWRVTTASGERFAGKVLVAAMGFLSTPSMPRIPGLEGFAGRLFHSAEWDHRQALDGERVAVIGTGASAVQLIPRIQAKAARLHVFQRTPAWVLPHRDRPITALEHRLYRSIPAAQRLVRELIYWRQESLVPFYMRPRRNGLPERLARRHLERQVADPDLRARLSPDYAVFCKRILLSDDYYPALQQPNVELVTEPIREVRRTSIVAGGGEREIDTIVCATGFKVTDAPWPATITGRDGVTLAEAWAGAPRAYYGTTVAGFPNLFLMLGPNTGLGHTSVVLMIEAQIDHLIGALKTMAEHGIGSVEVREDIQDDFNRRLQARREGSVWNAGGCSSWYRNAAGHNSTIWPGSTWRFRRQARRFDPGAYSFSPAARAGIPA